MLIPGLPAHESERTKALELSGLIYSPAEARYDRIVRLAKRYFGVTTALLSLVYKDEQWFKSRCGLNAVSTSRDVSFCGHAIFNDAPLVVEDALKDERFADNPLVTGFPYIRFYAGFPVRNRLGVALGTLCLFQSEPRAFTAKNLQDLRDFARLLESEFGRRAASPVVETFLASLSEEDKTRLIEPLTAAWNPEGIAEVVHREKQAALERYYGVSLLKVALKNYASFHEATDPNCMTEVLKQIADHLRDCVGDHGSVGYLGQGEFLLVCPFHNHEKHAVVKAEIQATFVDEVDENLPSMALDVRAQLLESANDLNRSVDEWLTERK